MKIYLRAKQFYIKFFNIFSFYENKNFPIKNKIVKPRAYIPDKIRRIKLLRKSFPFLTSFRVKMLKINVITLKITISKSGWRNKEWLISGVENE